MTAVHGWTFIAFGLLQVGVPAHTPIKHAEAEAEEDILVENAAAFELL